MDMIYRLPFRDWLELNDKGEAQSIAAADAEPENGSSGDRR